MKRIFLALRAHIYEYDKIKSDFFGLIKGSWVKEENLHVSICYFGDVYKIDEILERMPPLTQMSEELELNSLAFFEHSSILYAKTKSQTLDTMHSSVSTAFSLQDGKPFIPHVTLMRIKKIEDKTAFKEMLERYKDKTVGRVEARFELMQSRIMHPGGAEYKSIRKY